jgi:hypothetical protein
MINFKGLKDLFTILTVKHNPKKHWSDFTWWGIVESMNDLLLESIRKAINGASFLFVNSNEVIVIDNTSWIFIHCMLFKFGNGFHYWFVWRRLVCM